MGLALSKSHVITLNLFCLRLSLIRNASVGKKVNSALCV